MSLSTQVGALATGIANYIRDSVKPRLVPAGGVVNAHLVKTSASDYAMSWSRAASFSTLAVDARPSWAGYTPWDNNNFTPGNYAALGGNVSFNRISITENGTGASLALGDDAVMGDVNVANTIGIKGTSIPTQGFFQFGSAGSKFGYDGSNWVMNGGGNLFIQPGAGGSYPVWHSGNFNPSAYQRELGFTPVRQGGGAGQGTNLIYMGWSGSALKVQVDATDLGTIWADYYAGLSRGANGYMKLPNGMILQWGIRANVSGDFSFSLPTTFPNAIFGAWASAYYGATGTEMAICMVDQFTTSSIVIRNRRLNSGAVDATTVVNNYWFAIGW